MSCAVAGTVVHTDRFTRFELRLALHALGTLPASPAKQELVAALHAVANGDGAVPIAVHDRLRHACNRLDAGTLPLLPGGGRDLTALVLAGLVELLAQIDRCAHQPPLLKSLVLRRGAAAATALAAAIRNATSDAPPACANVSVTRRLVSFADMYARLSAALAAASCTRIPDAFPIIASAA